ncbi:hypothetical protein K438DRAFT_2025967 [Mycena galopus ATCC 62051]|nr:hypothetical protein K438DRAFT_2025967 [Mycena galopus ATCC 62051]
MSSAGSIDFSPLDSSTCRILTVSTTLDRAIALIDRVRDLRGAGQAPTPIATSEASSSVPIPLPASTETQSAQPQTGLGESSRIPWTLSNKYYSADVHFAAHTVTGLAPHTVRNVPAVIFVWAKGEAYKHHVERIAGDMSGYEPEVALAVRIAPSNSTEEQDKDDEEEEDGAEIDEFLSSNGFEFIDASEETPHGDSFSQGIPGLPRVLDALSTIMWPSMQAKAKPTTSGLPRLARRDDGFDWATHTSQDDISPIKKLSRGGSGNREQEMEELTRWLEGDDDANFSSQEDPWRSAADSLASPTAIDAAEFPEPADAKGFGFDDDFTVFVSAPPVAKDENADADADDSFDLDSPVEERLGAPGTSPLYLSLGSGLDLRLEEKGEDDAVDEDLPTDAEIEAMSSRIFGEPMRSTAGVETKGQGGEEDEYDMASFDLSRVMSALEGMKAEIASMEDEGERRKAAARVALGLVYGLEADAGGEDL